MTTATETIDLDTKLNQLKELARVTSTMVDGDEALRIIKPRSIHYILNPDPKFPAITGDFYDVDHPIFLRMKKTLMRLELLVDFECYATLWVKITGPSETYLTVAIQNGRLHRYKKFREAKRLIEGEMKDCMESGEITIAPLEESDALVTVLAPVQNSLYEVIGFVELTTLK